ncbi:metal tolerance protein 1 [Oryza brachyantha]|uniref:Metal tolerance protein 1-like n=1 Tax=Oryza brachyantha TaxID=4533 RepID=J3M3N0_ORYBR|nr:metal tolerance protein 1 [Oryza brachyantha]XP_015693292.1 metal tolerance protein 1 [Oryza brachyantha]
MDSHNSVPPQIAEVRMDISSSTSLAAGNKICRGAACDFSESSNSSKDARERVASMRKLIIAVILCIIFMTVEVVGGIKANSLAILTDAAHLLSDVAAFAISLFSLWAAGWEATPQQSYGFFRIEILGALVSIQLIWLLAGILVYEAIVRLINESGEVQGSLMFAVSAFGLFVNIIMAVLLGHDHGHGHGHGHGHSHDHDHGDSDDNHQHHDGEEHGHVHHQEDGHGGSITIKTNHHHHSGTGQHHHDAEEPLLKNEADCDSAQSGAKAGKKARRNINVHSAYLHVLGDSIQSIGVMIGGAIIWYKPEWKIIDLICTLIFSVIVLFTTIRMLRNILEVLMESTPREIDATRLENGLRDMDGVVAVHELHIWAITVGKVLLACHVTITQNADADQMLDKVIGYIKSEYNISHVTIQIERE